MEIPPTRLAKFIGRECWGAYRMETLQEGIYRLEHPSSGQFGIVAVLGICGMPESATEAARRENLVGEILSVHDDKQRRFFGPSLMYVSRNSWQSQVAVVEKYKQRNNLTMQVHEYWAADSPISVGSMLIANPCLRKAYCQSDPENWFRNMDVDEIRAWLRQRNSSFLVEYDAVLVEEFEEMMAA